MAEELVKTDAPAEEEFAKPDPKLNPRNISLGEIAKAVAEQHKIEFAETAPVVDEDNQPAEPPPATPDEPAAPAEEVAEPEAPAEAAAPASAPDPARESIDPAKEYEVTIDGQKLKVPGQKIIDAGFRTFQKETAADYRLQVATDLLRKAEEQARTTPNQGVPTQTHQAAPAEASDADLANAIQYGSQDQAAAAIAEVRKRERIDPAQIAHFVAAQTRNELAFQDGLKFVQTEYKDLLENPDIRSLFFVKENQARLPRDKGGLGDTRTPKELYQAIGEDIRKSLNRPKPAASTTQGSPTAPAIAVTAASRQERKAAAPSVPRTAAGRLAAASDAPKAKTTAEIISQMAARRGQGNLNRQLNKE